MVLRNSFALTVLMLIVIGCGSGQDQATALKNTDFNRLPQFLGAIGAATKTTVYEGLPHQYYEPSQLAQEKQSKKTLEICGFPFYSEAITPTAEHSAQLNSILGDSKNFSAWRGEKKCGGFHPDYAVEWDSPKGKVRALICFGCREVILSLPSVSVRCDIDNGVSHSLSGILGNYRKNRPPQGQEIPK